MRSLLTLLTTFSCLLSQPELDWINKFAVDSNMVALDGLTTDDEGFVLAGIWGRGSELSAFMARTDELGDTLWTWRHATSHEQEFLVSVTSTQDGNYLAVGNIRTYLHNNVWMVKMSADGDTLWSKIHRNLSFSSGVGCASTADGGFIVTAINDDPLLWLIRTDSLGDTLWTRVYECTNAWEHNGIAQTMDGGYLYHGTGNYYTEYETSLLLRLDSQGDSLWAWRFSTHKITTAQEMSNGDYLVLYEDTLARLDPLGDELWKTTFCAESRPPKWASENPDGTITVYGGTSLDSCTVDAPAVHWGISRYSASGELIMKQTIQPPQSNEPFMSPRRGFQFANHGYGVIGYKHVGRLTPDLVDVDAYETNPTGFRLQGVFPNPFNFSTTIAFQLHKTNPTTLTIYNLLGQEVFVEALGVLNPGFYRYSWEGSVFQAGVYVVELRSGTQSATQRVVLLK